MATQTASKPEPQHPPLARDAQGNLIEIPDGTAAWRLCRQTTGRPKEILGPDKRPLRFPLETTADEIADLCGPDVYRVYALDDVGKVLDYVVTVDVTREPRDLRNAAPDSLMLSRTAPAQASDMRFALEAMAQMMRVNSEALRAVAESQADWVKSIASARGFFRNGPPPLPPEPPRYDEEDDDDDDEPTQRKTIYDVLAPLAENLAPSVKPLMSALAGAGTKTLTTGDDASLADKPKWELRDFIDLKYAAAKGQAKRAAAARPSLQSRIMADPKLLAHFMAIKLLLNPEETAQIVALGERISAEEQDFLFSQISALQPDHAATLLRATLAELNNQNESTDRTE